MFNFVHLPRRPSWPVLVLIGILVLCVSTLLALYWGTDPTTRDQARLELFKAVLNFTLIVIVGGFVSVLYKRFERQRTEAAALKGFRAAFLARLQASYRMTKSVRRALRAAGLTTMRRDPLTDVSQEQADVYRGQMANLNEAQLDFEDLALELQAFPASFSAGPRVLEIIREIAGYLRKILREYENHGRKLGATGDAHSSFDALDHLRDFTGSFQEGEYRKTVVQLRGEAVRLIEADLLLLPVAKGGKADSEIAAP